MDKSDEFNAKRIQTRLSGWLKTVYASEAALWMRVDGEQRLLAFDYLNDRVVSPVLTTHRGQKFLSRSSSM